MEATGLNLVRWLPWLVRYLPLGGAPLPVSAGFFSALAGLCGFCHVARQAHAGGCDGDVQGAEEKIYEVGGGAA